MKNRRLRKTAAHLEITAFINLIVVLVIGFVLHLAANVGAGDVKFAAAAAPFPTRLGLASPSCFRDRCASLRSLRRSPPAPVDELQLLLC